MEKYSYYNKANIDIYKPTDKAFCESCYITNGLNYDLTQKFRRTQIYENSTFISDDCRYSNIDIQMNKIKMFCNYVENLTYSYSIIEKYLDIKDLNKVDNLPFKCASSVEKLESNIGFWIHFILTIIVLGSGSVYSIIHYYHTYYKSNNKINYFTQQLQNESTEKIKETEKNEIENENTKIENENENESENENDKNISEKVIEEKVLDNEIDKKIEFGEKNENKELDNKLEADIIIIKKQKVDNNVINVINKEKQEDKSSSINSSIEEENKKEKELKISDDNNKSSNNHPFDNYFEEVKTIEVKKTGVEEGDLEIPKGELIDEMQLEYENGESLKKILMKNLYEYYPFMTFFNTSFIHPLFINICLFTFNIILIFSGNAIFYPEKMIEKRIFDNNRSKFIYPLSKEIVKIILSILFSMICMLIIRAISLIPRIKNKKLFEYIHSHSYQENVNNKVLKNFFIRRMISCFIMLFASIFFLYYIIVFCSMYKQTQLNWFISGFWSILFEWILLVPLYILIISIVEKKGRSQKISSYYMKQLFMF